MNSEGIKIYRYFRLKLEALIWITALILLATMEVGAGHHSLCFFSNIGIGFCPGCGLGHSIAYLFRGDIIASFDAHPLGIPVVILLVYRIIKVLFFQKDYQFLKT